MTFIQENRNKFLYIRRFYLVRFYYFCRLRVCLLQISNTPFMAKQFGIIFGCLLVGELLAMIPWLSIPGSIWGMLLLTVLLERKVINPNSIAPVCRFLIKNMAFFFIPPGVALMLYFDIIAAEWFPITVATIVSIFLVIVVTGRLHQFLHHRIKKHR